jgi:VWFA-related protein
MGCINVLPDEQGSLEDLARATGGKAYYNRNDLDAAVGDAIATGADYYAISYVPPRSGYDDEYHSINVKVDHSGVHLQYREGYTSVDLAKSPKPVAKGPGKNAPPPPSEF